MANRFLNIKREYGNWVKGNFGFVFCEPLSGLKPGFEEALHSVKRFVGLRSPSVRPGAAGRGICATALLLFAGGAFSFGALEDSKSHGNAKDSPSNEMKRLIMIAGEPSHARGAHEHPAGVRLLADCLEDVPGLEVVAYYNAWPEDPDAFVGVDGILFYMDGGPRRHLALRDGRLKELQKLMDKGVGLAAFHFAVDVPPDRGGAEFRDWLGGHYEGGYSVNPMWRPEFDDLPDHPITRGVEPFSIRDEWYFNIRFREDMEGVTPILQATPSHNVREGPYVHPRGPYPHIVEAEGRIETIAWAVEREDGGRGFGFTGGHFHANWGDDNFRKIALNALVWISGAEVPEGGVVSFLTDEEVESYLD